MYGGPIHNDGDFYRRANGQADISARCAEGLRLERIDRFSAEPVLAQYRQPCLSLFLFDPGYERFTLEAAGVTRSVVEPSGIFALLPAASEIRGEFYAVENLYAYSIAQIEIAFLTDADRVLFERPLIGFEDTIMQCGMNELATWEDDPTFSIMAEGWALQCIARLRSRLGSPPPSAGRVGGLSAEHVMLVRDYIEDQLAERLSLRKIAATTGLGVRQFSRCFQSSFGCSPARFIHDRRLSRAKDHLAASAMSMTQIAHACGYSHAQHFSNSFLRSCGVTPSRYRANFALSNRNAAADGAAD